jgi:hypothetical protein
MKPVRVLRLYGEIFYVVYDPPDSLSGLIEAWRELDRAHTNGWAAERPPIFDGYMAAHGVKLHYVEPEMVEHPPEKFDC